MKTAGKWFTAPDGYLATQDPSSGEVKDIASIICEDGDVYHIQNVDRILAHCAVQRQRDTGWNIDRTMRRMASIPQVEFLNHPELAYDDKFLADWLRKHPEYRTVEESNGRRSANIIIK